MASLGECAYDLEGLARPFAQPVSCRLVLLAPIGRDGSQLIISPGSILLVQGEFVDRLHRPGAISRGLLNGLAGVGRQGRHGPMSFRGRPVDLCLIPFAARLLPQQPPFLTVEALRAQRDQFARPANGFQGAPVQGLGTEPGLAGAPVEVLLAFVGAAFSLVGLGLPLVG